MRSPTGRLRLGADALTRTTPGEGVEATVEVDDDNDAVFVLDPRAGLTVRLIKEFGEYRVRIEWGDDEEGWYEQDLDHRHPGVPQRLRRGRGLAARPCARPARRRVGRRDAAGARRRSLRVTVPDEAGLRPALLDEPAGEGDCEVCGNGHGFMVDRAIPLAQAGFRE